MNTIPVNFTVANLRMTLNVLAEHNGQLIAENARMLDLVREHGQAVGGNCRNLVVAFKDGESRPVKFCHADAKYCDAETPCHNNAFKPKAQDRPQISTPTSPLAVACFRDSKTAITLRAENHWPTSERDLHAPAKI